MRGPIGRAREDLDMRYDLLKGTRNVMAGAGPLMVVLLALLACKEEGATSTPSVTPAASGVAKSEEGTKPAAAAAKVGDTVKFDDSTWVVVSAKDIGKKLKSVLGDKTTEGKFVKVVFKVTNTTKEEERIMDHPKLLDDQGREFGNFDEASMYLPDNEKTMTLEQLPAGMPKTFSAIYEVPDDAKGLKFQARALSALGNKTLVDLGI